MDTDKLIALADQRRNAIKRLIQESGLSKRQWIMQAGVPYSTLAGWLKKYGTPDMLHDKTYEVMAQGLKLPVYILKGQSAPVNPEEEDALIDRVRHILRSGDPQQRAYLEATLDMFSRIQGNPDADKT